MFHGREQELAALEKMYATKKFQMAVVYGRRRIGKTALLNKFITDKNGLYLPAEEVNDSLNLKKFSLLLGIKLGINHFPTVENWNDFFLLIKETMKDERLVLVIDEYPYAATANKSLNSILQHLIDYELKETNMFLILCGSSMSFMEDHVLGEKSPLFGRRTGQLKINPLDYYDAAKFYPDASAEDKIKYYATIGGTPYYLSLINNQISFDDNIKSLYFEISGYLLNEGILLMKQEFREPANYNAILQAIASGARTLNEIAGFTKLENTSVSKYLNILQELNYIERIIPFGSNPLKGKISQYQMTENFIAFWYRYVFSVRSEIERGNGDVYHELALANLTEYIGHIFEEITLQYLRRLNKMRSLPFIAKSFGRWWGKDKQGNVQDVDIVLASATDKTLIIGECKWRENFNINDVLNKLETRSDIFSDYITHKFLFTKHPLETTAHRDVICLSLEDYFKIK